VQRSIAEEFIGPFRRAGPPDPDRQPDGSATELGPLAFGEHMKRVLSFVEVARADGATLLTGGRRAPRFDRGYFVEPTAVLATATRAASARRRSSDRSPPSWFYDTIEEAIAIANDSPFAWWPTSGPATLGVVMRASRELRAGTVWVNTTMVRELRAPFGGYKQSASAATVPPRASNSSRSRRPPRSRSSLRRCPVSAGASERTPGTPRESVEQLRRGRRAISSRGRS